MTSKSTEFRFQHILLGRDSLAIILAQVGAWSNKELDPQAIFKDFVKQNSVCFWNQCLVQSVKNLGFRGWIVPMTVVVGGSDFALEVVRSAWARRVLRPPRGYTICKLGDISILELHPVPQTQFAPLSEALCKVVVELNSENVSATATSVAAKLQEFFPKMEVPSEEILYKTLGGLIRERKLYHTGEGYFVVSPDTYRQRALSPLCERQMLMTNEEAIVRLHGDQRERSLAVQVDESDIAASWQCSSSPNSTLKQNYAFSSQHSSPINNPVSPATDLRVVERSHSLRVLRVKGKATATREIFGRYGSFKDHSNKKEKFSHTSENDSCDRQRCEKQSMLSRLFRRMQSLTEKSNKHGTFSVQFPPLEWFGSEQLHSHSVATQTQLQFRKFQSKPNNKKPTYVETEPVKITWPRTDLEENNTSQNLCKIVNKGLPTESETHFVHKKTNFFPRPSVSKYSPSHRHSYATFNHHTKHHCKHRRSSSESPKSDKTKTNEVGVLYERKVDNVQNVLGNRTSNPKAIISPCSIVYKQTVPNNLPLNFNSVATAAPSPSINIGISSPILMNKVKMSTPVRDSSNDVIINFPKSVSLVNQASSFNRTPKKRTKLHEKATILQGTHSRSNSVSSSELKLSMSESNSEPPIFTKETKLCEDVKSSQPMAIGDSKDSPKIVNDSIPLKKGTSTKEILIDNSVNIEVAVEKKNPKVKSNNVSTISQTVTEETTVKKGNGKVITVTSVTTSLTHGSTKDNEKHCQELNLSDVDKVMKNEDILKVNDLNVESKNNSCVIDCSSSCNIITELK